MTATSHFLYKVFLLLGFSFPKKKLKPQLVLERRFLDMLHLELGRRLWREMSSVSGMEDTYSVLAGLEKTLGKNTAELDRLEKHLATLQETAPEEDFEIGIAGTDMLQEKNLSGKITFQNIHADLFEHKSKLAELENALGKDDPLCVKRREIIREKEEKLKTILDSLNISLNEPSRRDKQILSDTPASLISLQEITKKIQMLKNDILRIENLMHSYYSNVGFFINENVSLLKRECPAIRRQKKLLSLLLAAEKSTTRIESLIL